MPGRFYGQLDKEIEEYGSPVEDPYFDREIIPFVTELLHMGYSTSSSCSGHPGSSQFNRGFVHFDHDLTNEEVSEVEEIARRHKLTNIKVYKRTEMGCGSISFNSIGKPRHI